MQNSIWANWMKEKLVTLQRFVSQDVWNAVGQAGVKTWTLKGFPALQTEMIKTVKICWDPNGDTSGV